MTGYPLTLGYCRRYVLCRYLARRGPMSACRLMRSLRLPYNAYILLRHPWFEWSEHRVRASPAGRLAVGVKAGV